MSIRLEKMLNLGIKFKKLLNSSTKYYIKLNTSENSLLINIIKPTSQKRKKILYTESLYIIIIASQIVIFSFLDFFFVDFKIRVH